MTLLPITEYYWQVRDGRYCNIFIRYIGIAKYTEALWRNQLLARYGWMAIENLGKTFFNHPVPAEKLHFELSLTRLLNIENIALDF